jgi:DNA processing protein
MHLLNNRAPVLLFARGNLDLFEKPSLGFCGSRKASEKGLKAAWDIADQMARRGVNIVSGYASGVDMTTHKTALETGGSTTIVLAEGILNFKIKKVIKELFDESRILVLSEFLPRLPWSVRNAMQRNSTICLLSDAMVLIEAEERGGSISAGRACLDMQRPLFAPVYEGMPKSATGNAILLEKGAHGLKKSRRTDRANLIRIEQLLFRDDAEEKGYPADLNPDAEQLALFEDPAPYKTPKENS